MNLYLFFDIMPTHAEDLSGRKYGKLTVVSMYCRTPQRKYKWLCKCDCGNECVVFGSKLRTGYTRSCGCLRHKSPPNKTHGKKSDPLYPVWCEMKYRCTNPNHSAYKWYGGKGIRVCDEWYSDFQKFYDWMHDHGWQPGLTIDRINPKEGYSPENCRIADMTTQQNNRSNNVIIEYMGIRDTISGWAARLGISRGVIASRYYRNFPTDKILSKYNLQNGKKLGD